MVEPNVNDVLFREKGESESKYSGQDKWPAFMAKFRDTNYNWHRMAKRIALAIRKVDQDTPILVSTMDWASHAWLGVLTAEEQVLTPRTLCSVHCYDPYIYTSERDDETSDTYPGEMHPDGDEDKKKKEKVGKEWLVKDLRSIDAFRAANPGVPIAVTEFGPIRWKHGRTRIFSI